MAAAELVVIRHGESLGNVAWARAYAEGAEVIAVEGRDADVALSTLGEQRADALGGGLRTLLADGTATLVWSSPYVRAHQTATRSLAAAGVEGSVRLDERLRDRDLGVLEGLTWPGIIQRFPQEAERRRRLGKFYHRPPAGESWADVVLRVRSFLRDLDDVPDGTRVVVFCHDAVVLCFRYACEGLTEQEVLDIGRETPVRNVSITHLGRGPEAAWQVRLFNDVSHLDAP